MESTRDAPRSCHTRPEICESLKPNDARPTRHSMTRPPASAASQKGPNLPPIQWDQSRDEPYLELEHRGERYTLTMWRESDGDDMVSLVVQCQTFGWTSAASSNANSTDNIQVRNWNHPLVGVWSFRRPYPCVSWLNNAQNMDPADECSFTHDHLPATWNLFLIPDRSHIDSYRSLQPPHEGRFVLRALRSADGKMIGNVDLFNVKDEGRWEIAYDLDPDHWGKGLGSMAVDFLVRWASATGVKLISAVIDHL